MSATQEKPKPNYLIKGASFGGYVRGNVVPAYALMQNGDLRAHVEIGMIEETQEKVNVRLVAPKVTDATAETAAVETIEENNRLRVDLDRVTQEGLAAIARYDDAKQQADALKGELADKVTEIDRFRRLLDEERRGRETAQADNHGLKEEASRLRAEVAELKLAADKAPVPFAGESKDTPPALDQKPASNATQRIDVSPGFK